MSADADQVMAAYRRYRIHNQVDYFSRQASVLQQALRRTTRISAALLVMASLFGALGAVDADRRGMWAFLAATFAALSTAVAAYEVAFGFERLSRQYADTLAALKLADAECPPTLSDDDVARQVARIERLLRSEVDSWSRVGSDSTLPGQKSEGVAARPGPEAPP